MIAADEHHLKAAPASQTLHMKEGKKLKTLTCSQSSTQPWGKNSTPLNGHRQMKKKLRVYQCPN